MRTRMRIVVSGGLAVAFATVAARAQGPPPGGGFPPGGPGGPGMMMPMGGPGGPGGPGGGPSLVMSEAVQDDLGLTDKQKTQLKRLEASQAQKRRELFSGARDGGVDPEEMRSAMNDLRREHDAAVGKVLTKAQKARLAQLDLQREGIMAVGRSEVAGKLKLTSAQTKKVKAILDEMRQTMFRAMPAPPGGGFPPGGDPPGDGGAPPGGGRRRGGGPRGGGQPPPGGDAVPGGGGPPGGENAPGGGPPGGGNGPGAGGPPGGPPNFNSPEMRAQFEKMRAQFEKIRDTQEKIRASTSRKITEVLTRDQNAAFEKMQGKPFDFSKLRFGPGPGGGPPPGNDGQAQPKSKSRRGPGR